LRTRLWALELSLGLSIVETNREQLRSRSILLDSQVHIEID
jgi:hypothetical protein